MGLSAGLEPATNRLEDGALPTELREQMTDRMRCCVPHCKRTTRRNNPAVVWPDNAWICAEHWQAAAPIMRRVKARARRLLRKDEAMLSRFLRISSRCTRAAIERAMGIGG